MRGQGRALQKADAKTCAQRRGGQWRPGGPSGWAKRGGGQGQRRVEQTWEQWGWGWRKQGPRSLRAISQTVGSLEALKEGVAGFTLNSGRTSASSRANYCWEVTEVRKWEGGYCKDHKR